MVNGAQNPPGQQMRFQLNSKRFSNVKEANISGNIVAPAAMSQS
jgi:hypothetical protein